MKTKQKPKTKVKAKTKVKFKPKTLMENAHDIASDLYETGMINLQTMRNFDMMCFPEVKELSSTQIRNIRLRENMSQPLFASCLNISPITVKKWEQGENQPNGLALKVLNVIAEKGLSVFA